MEFNEEREEKKGFTVGGEIHVVGVEPCLGLAGNAFAFVWKLGTLVVAVAPIADSWGCAFSAASDSTGSTCSIAIQGEAR